MRRHSSLGMILGCLFLVLVSHAVPGPAQTFVGARFPIATGWVSVGAAFDGTSYLGAMETGSHLASVAAQLISPNGTAVGSPIAFGRSGHTCCNAVAFDGTRYLMVWEDEEPGASAFTAYGQFVTTAGVVLGQPFAITDPGIWVDGVKFLAYGGGSYLMTYTRLIVPANGDRFDNRYIAGRIISPDGTLGNEIRISSGFGAGSSIGFDGTNFFVVWKEDSLDYEVRGRFVGPTGALGQEISINASPAASDSIVQLAFDGTNYLVVFHDQVGSAATSPVAWDVYGQLVSTAGALVGGVITISNDPGTQLAMGIAFDGTNYLTAWTDVQASTNWIYGRFIGKDGALVGDKLAIDTRSGSQFGGVAGYQNGSYLVLVNSGAQLGSNGLILSGASVSGLLVGTYQPPAPLDPDRDVTQPPATQDAYTIPSGQLPEAAVVDVKATGTFGHANLQVILNIGILSPAAFAADATYNVYVAALVPGSLLGSTDPVFFVKAKDVDWSTLQFPIAAFLENVVQFALDQQVTIDILTNTDISSLPGTEVYIGYGTSSDDMLSAGRYRGVYKVQ